MKAIEDLLEAHAMRMLELEGAMRFWNEVVQQQRATAEPFSKLFQSIPGLLEQLARTEAWIRSQHSIPAFEAPDFQTLTEREDEKYLDDPKPRRRIGFNQKH